MAEVDNYKVLKGNEYHLQRPPIILNFGLKLKYNCSYLSTSYRDPNRFLEFVNDENVTWVETSWKEFWNDRSKIVRWNAPELVDYYNLLVRHFCVRAWILKLRSTRPSMVFRFSDLKTHPSLIKLKIIIHIFSIYKQLIV